MTLALYGKSRRRQGGLILAGIIALLVAMAAGVAVVQQALAHHNEYHKAATCQGWTADAGYVGGSSVRLVIIERVVIGGQNYQTSWSSGFNTGTGTSGGIQAYGGGAINGRTLPASGAGQITDNTNVFYWFGTDSTLDPNRPSGRGYHWTIFNRSGGWPAGTFSGRVLMYSQGANNTWNYISNESLTSFEAPSAPTNCGFITISKGQCAPQGPAWMFHFVAPNTDAGQGGTITVGYTVDGGPVQQAQQAENGNGAKANWWVTIPFNGGNTITIVSASASGGPSWNDINGADNKTASSTACQPQVVLPAVKKVAVDPPANLSGGYAFWDIVITPAGANSPAFENLLIEDFYTDIEIASQSPAGACEILADSKTLSCDVPAGASPVTVRIQRAVAPIVQNQCLGGEISNKLVSASYNQQSIAITQGTTPITYTVPGVPSACDKPGITKTTSTTSTTNPNDVSWTVQVTNPASGTGTQQTVWIKDSNVVVVSGPTFTGGANCDPNSTNPNFETQLNDSDGVQCSMPNNSTITFKVKPAGDIARACADQKFNNTAEIYVGGTTNTPVSAVGPEIILLKDVTKCNVKVTFSKFICQTYGDVPRNEGPGGQNDIGKNDGPAGLTADDLGPIGPAGGNTPVNLENDNRGAGCALATTPWTFNIWTNVRQNGSGGDLLQTFDITGTQEVTLNAGVVAATLESPGAYVEEVYQAGYGFGALKCYTDHLNDDNWEWLDFTAGIPEGPVHCIAYNVPATRDLQVCKVVVGNGDGIVDGGVFKFNITGIDPVELVAYEPAGDATDGAQGTEVCKTVKVGIGAVTVTEWEARPPTYGWEGSWNGDAPLFPQNSVYGLGQKNGTANVPADVNKVTFYNKTNPREREIIIEKFFLNLGTYQLAPGDWPTFVPNPPIDGWTFAANCVELANGIDPNHRAWSCKVPASWPGDFDEELDEDRWQQVECDFPEALRVAEVFTFCNEPVTRVIVRKQFVGDFTGLTFTFSDTNLPGDVADAPGAANTVLDVYDGQVEPDSFSVTENEFLTEARGCFGDGAAGYHTVYTIVKNGETTANQVEDDTADFSVAPGDEVVVTFINARCGTLSSPQIVIQKFNDPAGNRTGTNGVAGFQFRVLNNGVEIPGSPFPLGVGPLLIPGLLPGTVEVYEIDPNTGGWVLTGSKTDLGDNGSFEFEVGGQPAARNIDFGEIIRFNFYNQPRVNITVSKTIFNNANPQGANGGSGWTFTLSGCGIGPDQQTTGASGSVSWTNLPPAVNCTYTVTETAKAGWIADQISYNTSPNQPGQTANLTFINRQIEGCLNANDCREIESTPTPTPTSTPTTPPGETPTAPAGETPMTPPDETPAASPTSEETVGGERTPGPGQPTPIAPSTGGGFGGQHGAGINLLLLLAGLIAISGGLSFIALGRRETTRR